MRFALIPIFGLILLSNGTTLANSIDEYEVELIDHGIYGPDRSKPEHLMQTDVIPAVVGTVFGVRIRLNRESLQTYTYRWSFPFMKNPDTERAWTEMTGVAEITTGDVHPFLVRINHAWEAVPGDWTIRLLDGERLLFERTFRVVESDPND